jgi:hypothetical protein
MTISGIYGGGGLAAVQYRQPWRNINLASSQMDTSQTASASSQATAVPGPAQNGLSALLGNMTAGGLGQFDTGPSQDQFFMPPPSQDGDTQGSSFGSNFASLLQSVFYGGMTGAQSTASAPQAALAGSSSQSSPSTGSTDSGDMTTAQTTATAIQTEPNNANAQAAGSTSSSSSSSSSSTEASASGTAATSSTGTQSTFMTDLGSLLSAVQSGDAAGSQSAATALINDIETQADEFRTRLASLFPPWDAGQTG